MLRPKQLTNLSSSARSFFISGSRCSAADGSCSCTDDEPCCSKRSQQRKVSASLTHSSNHAIFRNISSRGVSELSERVKRLSEQKNKVDHNFLISQDRTFADRSGEKKIMKSEESVKDGVEGFGCFPDIVNHSSSSHSSIVNSSKPISSARFSKAKVVSKDALGNTHPKPLEATVENPSNTLSSKDLGCRKGSSNSRYHDTFQTSRDDCSSSFECNSEKLMLQKAKGKQTCKLRGTDTSVQRNEANIEQKIPHLSTPNWQAVESVSHLLRQLKWSSATVEALENLNFRLDAYQANQVLKQLHDHSVALCFFHWLKRQPGFKHDGHTYTTMIGILGRAKQFPAIGKLLNQMAMDGCKPNVVTYNRLIHSYGRANYLSDAVAVFNKMQRVGCAPDRVTYCTIIDIHAKAGYLDFALEMYNRMLDAGLSPDTFTYSVMINCLGKAGNLVSAQKLFSEMMERGCIPNLVTFNIMIALHAKSRNYQNALKLYRDMQNAGFEPDKVTYSIVMEVMGHCGYLDEAEAVFGEMKRKKWVPDEPVYGLLIDLWGKSGNVEKAWEWYQAMVNSGMRPNVPTCNSLLNAFLKVNRLNDAHDLLQTMLGLGLNPSLQTYTMLLSFCREVRSRSEMTFCCKLMAATGHPAHEFLITMPSADPIGQNIREHVSTFLDVFHSEDRESKRGLMDAVVDFLQKSGLKQEASSVWEVAAMKNVYPDAVREKSPSYWLINLHVMSDGTATMALCRTLAWFRRNMLISGVCPTRIDIVTGWGRRSRVTGESLVRRAVEELLSIFSFPYFTESGNSGCFVGCGEPLNKWLLNSYVDRMHLL